MIQAQDREGYREPVYHQGETPPFKAAGHMLAPLIDRELAILEKHGLVNVEALYTVPKPTQKTPYDRAYVRDFDGALMVELPGFGCFVSEAWAVSMHYLSAERLYSPEADEARSEARKARKEAKKEHKAYGKRRQAKIAKQKELDA